MKLALHKKTQPAVHDPHVHKAMNNTCSQFMNYCEKENVKAKIVLGVSAGKTFFVVFTIGDKLIHFSLETARFSHCNIKPPESKILGLNGLPQPNNSLSPGEGRGEATTQPTINEPEPGPTTED